MIQVQNRTLFFGDNLKIMQKIPDETFDLIYLDPPFNSNRNYNVLFKEGQVDSSAQIHAFEDTWEWTPATIRLYEDLQNPAIAGYNPKIAILIYSLHEFIGDTPMMAYLVNMTARLIPLRRVLKSTGSLFLHCDPTASHYLKIIMDVIFGKECFMNEIIWHYKRWPAKTSRFQRMHDVILFYVKKEGKNSFNVLLQPLTEGTNRRWSGNKSRVEFIEGIRQVTKMTDEKSLGAPLDDVWNIPVINSQAKERLGYPTQKPEALLEQIIKATTNDGGWILDPFCGCGTTVAVVERLNRNWVGIDISVLAINVIADRLKRHYAGIKLHIDGIPTDYESAQKLAETDKFAFQDWAISLIGAYPPTGEARKGADRGVDGLILFRERASFKTPNPQLRKILVQVKGGGSGRKDIATLKGDMDRDKAPMGIFISLNNPTSEMKREAALAGEYNYSETTTFPKVQILSLKDWFAGRKPVLPTDTINPFKKAEVKETGQAELF